MNDVKTEERNVQVNAGQISILIATRGRVESLSVVLCSLQENTVLKDKVALWLYVDDDDQITLNAIKNKSLPDPGFPVHFHVGPRPGALGETHQLLWTATGGTSQIYMTTVDDARFGTRGWDNIVRTKFDEYPDGVLLAFPHDPMTADQATYPILGWKWILTIGKIYPGYFPYWGDDKWVDQVGCMAGRIDKLPINLDPIGGKGKTKRMRNHAFWTRYFQLTLEERKESALKLITVIHGQNSAALNAALARLEEAAAVFAKDQVKFSDVYSVFQEERHTEMTPEQRERFDAKLFKAESAAVSRLIGMAQEAIAKGKFAEAIEFLEATVYSDLRIRQVQMLKAECLRAFGRHAEAERMVNETMAVWPQMNFLRRSFRFLGMVANDGKRLLLGLTAKGKTRK